jgi:hypothetical protein
VNKHSPQVLAFNAVFFSCFGGIEIGLGVHKLLTAKLEYAWIGSFLIGSAFVLYGVFWAVMLVRRKDANTVGSPQGNTTAFEHR